jgi:hypothetical protein
MHMTSKFTYKTCYGFFLFQYLIQQINNINSHLIHTMIVNV